HDAALAAIEPDKVRAQPVDGRVVLAGEVATVGAFDFDDVGAEVGEVAACQRRGDGLLPGDDADACQRKTHAPIIGTRLPAYQAREGTSAAMRVASTRSCSSITCWLRFWAWSQSQRSSASCRLRLASSSSRSPGTLG